MQLSNEEDVADLVDMGGVGGHFCWDHCCVQEVCSMVISGLVKDVD